MIFDIETQLKNGSSRAIFELAKFEAILNNDHNCITCEHIVQSTKYYVCFVKLKSIFEEFNINELKEKVELEPYVINREVLKLDIPFDDDVKRLYNQLTDERRYYYKYINYEKFIIKSIATQNEKNKDIKMMKELHGYILSVIKLINNENKNLKSFNYDLIGKLIKELKKIKNYTNLIEWKYLIIDSILNIPNNKFVELEVCENIEKLFRELKS